MARTVRNASLESRTARAKLEIQHKPYFMMMDAGHHLSYRKGERSRTWHARFRMDNGKYKEHKLGLTDDTQDADGVNILSFSQAQMAARAWFSEIAKQQAGITYTGNYTFQQASEEYLNWFRSHRKSVAETERIVNTYLLPEFGAVELPKLTAKRINEWMNKLANTAGKLRSRKGAEPRYKTPLEDAESKRKRKATVNRILNVLKAILNHAYREGRVASDDQWVTQLLEKGSLSNIVR
jgi:hypothetical protein